MSMSFFISTTMAGAALAVLIWICLNVVRICKKKKKDLELCPVAHFLAHIIVRLGILLPEECKYSYTKGTQCTRVDIMVEYNTKMGPGGAVDAIIAGLNKQKVRLVDAAILGVWILPQDSISDAVVQVRLEIAHNGADV